MSPSRMLRRILLYSLLLTSVAGCHHRSAAPARHPASDAEEAGYGMQATTQSSIGVQTARPNQGGAVTTTRTEDLFAGLDVQRTGAGKVVLRIRGVEPLVVVNGLEGDSHLLLAVRPQDVTRIEVLRDPGATAIYGNRGLNGVVVITTRRGRSRRHPIHWVEWRPDRAEFRNRLALVRTPAGEELSTPYSEADMFERLAGLVILPLAVVACTEQALITAPEEQPLLSATTSTTVERFDGSGEIPFPHPCTDEPVVLEEGAFVQIVTHVTVNKNQAVFSFPGTAHGAGTGQESGIRYIVNASSNVTGKAPLVNGAAQVTEVYTFVWVAQGNAPNFTENVLARFTINANGEVTSELLRIEFECRG